MKEIASQNIGMYSCYKKIGITQAIPIFLCIVNPLVYLKIDFCSNKYSPTTAFHISHTRLHPTSALGDEMFGGKITLYRYTATSKSQVIIIPHYSESESSDLYR